MSSLKSYQKKEKNINSNLGEVDVLNNDVMTKQSRENTRTQKYHLYLVVVGVETLDDVDTDDDVDAELEVEALIGKFNTPKYMSYFT